MNAKTTWLLVTLLGGVAVAQEDAGVVLEIERVVDASPDQVGRWVEGALDEQQANQKALKELDVQTRRKVTDGLLCLTSALTASTALLESSGIAAEQVDSALRSGDRTRLVFALRQLSISTGKSRLLRSEGEKCALGVGVQSGNTRVTVEGSIDDAPLDLAGIADDILDYAFDPSATSPF